MADLETVHDTFDHSGLPGVGGSAVGNVLRVIPLGCDHLTDDGASATNSLARACPILIPSAMELRSLWMGINVSASGSLRWGLFNYASNPAAASLVAGGLNAPGGTGFREFAATGGPITVPAGNYMLVILAPATNRPDYEVVIQDASITMPLAATQASYTWDDTPDFTSGWTASNRFARCFLTGDMDGSGTRWLSG